MNSSKVTKAILYALYLNGALLLGILLTLWGRGRSDGASAAFGQAIGDQVPGVGATAGGATAGGATAGGATVGGSNGIFVMPCQFHPEVWGCYVLDTQRQTLCAYEYRSGDKTLVLSAARNFRFDLDLKNYNTSPAWYDIQKAVEEAAKSEHTNESQLSPLNSPAPRDNNQ